MSWGPTTVKRDLSMNFLITWSQRVGQEEKTLLRDLDNPAGSPTQRRRREHRRRDRDADRPRSSSHSHGASLARGHHRSQSSPSLRSGSSSRRSGLAATFGSTGRTEKIVESSSLPQDLQPISHFPLCDKDLVTQRPQEAHKGKIAMMTTAPVCYDAPWVPNELGGKIRTYRPVFYYADVK
mmetsp:Transcript_7737/g.10098  ORF Transcript_7737/g.10098 Transcript_7737/m.10098 type:complete len:181 (+) Transcript_7737:1-543(+)